MQNTLSNMTEIERNFIILSRIAVALRKKGLIASLTFFEEFIVFDVQLKDENSDFFGVENFYSNNCTEQELLEWWEVIEGEQ